MKILLLCTYYPEFLDELYIESPGLAEQGFETQRRAILDTGFASSDAYSTHLSLLGCEAQEFICNADTLQAQWACEHGLPLSGNVHERRRQVVAAQVRHYRPDVLYVFEWCPLGDGFLAEVKRGVRLLVGQIASPLRPERTYDPYDLIISSWPPIVDFFRGEGKDAEMIRLGFDARVLDHLRPQPPRYDVTFIGGFAPSHPDRVAWLEELLAEVDIDVFGYGVETTSRDSAIRAHHHGPVWGRRMYDVLRQSRITLNRHALNDVRGTNATHVANNMRLFEATGVGTCLLTDAKENLGEMFELDREILAYHDSADCIEKIRHYLSRDAERNAIACSGQARTLHDHTHANRARTLFSVLSSRV